MCSAWGSFVPNVQTIYVSVEQNSTTYIFPFWPQCTYPNWILLNWRIPISLDPTTAFGKWFLQGRHAFCKIYMINLNKCLTGLTGKLLRNWWGKWKRSHPLLDWQTYPVYVIPFHWMLTVLGFLLVRMSFSLKKIDSAEQIILLISYTPALTFTTGTLLRWLTDFFQSSTSQLNEYCMIIKTAECSRFGEMVKLSPKHTLDSWT